MIKKIKNYEDNYEIDDLGNIYSLPRNGTIKEKKIISSKINKYGYKQCHLMKNNKMKTFLVHRLVAQAFIPNPNKLPQVNHKDGNKSNNCVNNLEWVSVSSNTKHAFDNNLGGFRDSALRNLEKMNSNKYKKVLLEKDNQIITFNSTNEASIFLETNKDNISRAFKKGQRCKGYKVICERNC